MSDQVYYVLFGSHPVKVFEDYQDDESAYELTLERARYVRDHVINPVYNPRIVSGEIIR